MRDWGKALQSESPHPLICRSTRAAETKDAEQLSGCTELAQGRYSIVRGRDRLCVETVRTCVRARVRDFPIVEWKFPVDPFTGGEEGARILTITTMRWRGMTPDTLPTVATADGDGVTRVNR